MIQLTDLTKQYTDKIAVNKVSFQLRSGKVTGFLGPNGAGKSTTIRMILNLTLPTAGRIAVDGKVGTTWEAPLKKIGAVTDANAIDSRLTPRQYLRILTTASGIDVGRVVQTLSFTGLKEVGDKKIGEFSLGMRQRVALAAALIGDPETVLLDEPFNGLDVDGIHWLRTILRELANQGKAILISSHLLSEVQEIADRIVLLVRGELIADVDMEELKKTSLRSYVRVRTDGERMLSEILSMKGAQVEREEDGGLKVRKMSLQMIGDTAFEHGLRLYELTNCQPSLEQLFIELVEGESEYRGTEIFAESRGVRS